MARMGLGRTNQSPVLRGPHIRSLVCTSTARGMHHLAGALAGAWDAGVHCRHPVLTPPLGKVTRPPLRLTVRLSRRLGLPRSSSSGTRGLI